MDTPHVLDTVGREAFRLELQKEVRRKGGYSAEEEGIDSLRKKLLYYEVNGKFPEAISTPRAVVDAVDLAVEEEKKPAAKAPRGINSGKLKTLKQKKGEGK